MSSPPKAATSSTAPAPAATAAAAAAEVTTTTQNPTLEAETSESDIDSSYSDSDLESYTTSLSSKAHDFNFQYGRRYHKYEEGAYAFPNDEEEKDRLDMHHHMLTIVQKGKLFGAPIGENPQQILDIGTGTGIWSIEIADCYPSAVITGNDLSPIQPTWVPPNVKFEVDNVELEWTHPPDTFDLVYCRYMLATIKDWPKLIRQGFKAVKPGGYMEVFHPSSDLKSDDDSLPADSAFRKWNELFISACDLLGASTTNGPEIKNMMADAGFVDIHEDIYKLPNAPWPKDKHLKEIGAYHMASVMEGLEALSLILFTTVHKMTVEEIQVFLVDVRKDMRTKSIHTYYNLYRVYGRKPE